MVMSSVGTDVIAVAQCRFADVIQEEVVFLLCSMHQVVEEHEEENHRLQGDLQTGQPVSESGEWGLLW